MRLRDALLILSPIVVIGCHSHASGPLVVVQCPGPEIDEPEEAAQGGVSIPFYGGAAALPDGQLNRPGDIAEDGHRIASDGCNHLIEDGYGNVIGETLVGCGTFMDPTYE